MTEPAETIDRLAAKAGRLYTLPAVAVQVLDLTANPLVDTHALKECIEKDPALTTRLLRVVNSSLFGLSREVCDLSQALVMLGIKPLKLMVLGFNLPGELFAGLTTSVLANYWRYALTKAVAAREISREIASLPGDDAFLAGLLDDLGILVLIRELGDPYVRLLDQAHVRGLELRKMERELLGFDHGRLTARLLAQWNLPAALVEAASWTADDAESEPLGGRPRLVDLVRMADLLARLLAGGRPEVLDELLSVGEKLYGLSAQQLSALVETLEEKVRELADVLSVEVPMGLGYADVLARTNTQLAEAADEAAVELVAWRTNRLRPEEETLIAQYRQLSGIVSGVERGLPVGAPQCRRPSPRAPSANRPAVKAAAPTVAGGAAAESTLLEGLGEAVASCRQSRCPLSLMLVELDRPDQQRASAGTDGFVRLRRMLESACRGLDHPVARCLRHGDAGLALILPDCDRRQVAKLGNQLIDQIRGRTAAGERSGDYPSASVSVGAATVSLPPRNFPPKDLLVAADRCLYGSHASGGGVFKSIEIY